MVSVLSMKRRFLRQYNAKWTETMKEIPEPDWTEQFKAMIAGSVARPIRAWRSREFIAIAYHEAGKPVRLSVCRTTLNERGDYSDNIQWVDLQRIKSECGYGDTDALEVYPADADVVNVANMRHLWLCDEPSPLTWR